MLWDIEIRARLAELEVDRVRGEYRLLAHAEPPAGFITAASRGYLVEGEMDREQARELALRHALAATGTGHRSTPAHQPALRSARWPRCCPARG